jgi:hypothetical protein
MRKILYIGTVLAMMASAAPIGAAAQVTLPLQLTLSGGAAFPLGEFGRDDAFETGWGFEVNASMQIAQSVGLYAGYDRYTFQFDQDVFFGFGQQQGDLVDQGFAGGVLLAMPSSSFSVSPWIRGGAVYNSAKLDYDNLDNEPESDSALGFEVGAGLDFPLGYVVSIAPSVRYRSYAPDFDGQSDFDLSYLVGEIGLTFRF